jgi:DNA-binding IscR family transcriptional regulator
MPPEQIRLLAIVQAIDGARLNDCILEDHHCGDPRECLLHPAWGALREQFVNYLERTTLADLARMRNSLPVPIAHADHAPEVNPSRK